ncbi:MAG TPA: hypothetical protein PLZ79_12720 [Burkholderiales bacterium]|nr:hypothetical protein [Betaproteobacteria bacterium]HQR54125.1 hypothetical protein [Burkholderiales bacterium]
MGLPTLSVLDMERMALGEDVRNAPQRPAGAENEHLSQRRDEVIADLAGAMGLAAANPVNKEEVLEALAAADHPLGAGAPRTTSLSRRARGLSAAGVADSRTLPRGPAAQCVPCRV